MLDREFVGPFLRETINMERGWTSSSGLGSVVGGGGGKVVGSCFLRPKRVLTSGIGQSNRRSSSQNLPCPQTWNPPEEGEIQSGLAHS